MHAALRILLIDDNPDDRILTIHQLEQEFSPLQVTQILDEQSFWQALEQGDFALVITDYRLHWSDGLTVLRAVKTRYADCPVIMLTGTGNEEVAVEAMKAGLDDYVIKTPSHWKRLPAAVRSVMERRQQRQIGQDAAHALRQRMQEVATLIEVGKTVIASLDLREVLDRIVDRTCFLLRTQRAGLALVESSKGGPACRFVATRGLSPHFPRRVQHRHWRDGTTPAAIVERRPVWSSDLLHDPAFPLSPAIRAAVEAEGYRAVLSVPLLIGERVLGALAVYRDTPGPFTPNEIELLEAFAAQAAIALENARLYQEVRSREELLRQFTENAQEVFWITDAERTQTLYVSPAYETIWGRSLASLYDDPHSWLEAVHEEDRPRVVAALAKLTQGKYDEEYRIIRPDGSVRWIRDRAFLIRNDQGVVYRLAGIAADVTEYKRLEAQLYQAQKMEAIGRLAGGIAHDFNNLLVVITGYSELLLQAMRQDVAWRQQVEEIYKAAQRAARLTTQLLAFSRKQVLQPQVLDLNALVGDLSRMLSRLLGEDIDLVTVFDPALGQIRADPGQIEQVIMNLAVNARDAMPEGGQLTIETSNVTLDDAYAHRHADLVTPGPYVLLAVSDTGHGMDAATLARIFEPFFTTKAPGKGTGLGLATVYGMVKQSGGYIWVYSEPGQGTTFKLYFPRIDAQAATLASPLVSPAGGTETILVVEDDESVRRLVQQMLQRYGYAVLTAASGEEALQRCTQHPGPIHLVLTDVVMPQMHGRELVEQLQRLYPEMRVLYMSGYTDNAVVHRGVLEPGTVFLQKPFTPDTLARKVREALGPGRERTPRPSNNC